MKKFAINSLRLILSLGIIFFTVTSSANAQTSGDPGNCNCNVVPGEFTSGLCEVSGSWCNTGYAPLCDSLNPTAGECSGCTCVDSNAPEVQCGQVGQPYCTTGEQCPGGYPYFGTCVASPKPGDLAPLYRLCDSFPSDVKSKCEECTGTGENPTGIWTGLGCIHTDPKTFITDFLKLAIGIAGGIALLLMIYGAFMISVSAGDPKKADEGKEIITGAIAGLLFIIFSVILLQLIGVQILQIPGL